ncbi:anthranilate synthase component i [Fusarium heterosporum]|uniref:Anthranilate synthase component i n=1 Tax=Fusarium heterosporum TaxID=42747 RepID=A0A8H5T5H0_FUSHE|nr:anthranilate synthase component i [Fusarium heterosporum]
MDYTNILRQLEIRPTADEARDAYNQEWTSETQPTLLPVCASAPADLLTPSAIYLKLSSGATAEYSFLLESATGSTETVGRYSFIGANPRKVLATGDGYEHSGDPLKILAAELSQDRVLDIPSLRLPALSGGAVGYVSYDCIKYFEPRTDRPLKDNLKIPEALFMLFDTVIALDHFRSTLTIVTHMKLPKNPTDDLQPAYDEACKTLRKTLDIIYQPETPLPPQTLSSVPESEQEYSSNVGRKGYETFVTELKKYIVKGDIIQAVPSQRFKRSTKLHPFNIYRTLRTLNPSPYVFFLSCGDFHIVGASPECLMKTDGYAALPTDSRIAHSAAEARSRPRIVNHAIAGTIHRGKNAAEDERLAAELLASKKDRAEHVMLVDLARNDVNRVCHPMTVKVDQLMKIDRFSHVQHITSEVSGTLRPSCTRWDALRSIFPAGTVSGAPKIRAMELIYDLEGEKRGIYAGAAGWFGYDIVRVDDNNKSEDKIYVDEGPMDTCIAIRTMLVKDGVAYMQAGGGIVYDSDPTDEWMETMNKLSANLRCVELSEKYFGNGVSTKTVEEIIAIERKKGEEEVKAAEQPGVTDWLHCAFLKGLILVLCDDVDGMFFVTTPDESPETRALVTTVTAVVSFGISSIVLTALFWQNKNHPTLQVSTLPVMSHGEGFWPSIRQATVDNTTSHSNKTINPQCPICLEFLTVQTYSAMAARRNADVNNHGDPTLGEVMLCGHIICQACRREIEMANGQPLAKCPVCRADLNCSHCDTHSLQWPLTSDTDEEHIPMTTPEGGDHAGHCPECRANEEFHEAVDQGDWHEEFYDMEPGFVQFFYHMVNMLEKANVPVSKTEVILAFKSMINFEFDTMMARREEVVAARTIVLREHGTWFPMPHSRGH